MNKSPVRKEITDTLVESLKLLDHIHAMAQFGAAASGRLDEYSDAGLAAVVNDDKTYEVFSVTEQVLSSLAPLATRLSAGLSELVKHCRTAMVTTIIGGIIPASSHHFDRALG